eukprot:Gb_10997 [translate_table: standard]
MASFSSTHVDDNLRSKIALLIGEVIRSPLEEIRVAMGKMVQALRLLHVANERRGQRDESSVEEEGHRRPRDRRREVLKSQCDEKRKVYDYMRTHSAKAYANFPAKKVVSFSQTNPENAVGSLSVHKVKRTSGPDWEDDGTKGTTRMRGLHDFGLRIASQKKQPNMAALCEGIPTVTIPENGVPCPPYAGCGMGCGSPANNSKGSSLTLFYSGIFKLINKKFHKDMVDRGSTFPIEGQVTLTSKEGLDETRFSRYLYQLDSVEQSMGVVTDQGVSQWQSKAKRNIRTLNKKHGESSNGRSFLKTSDACTALMHGIAFEDKVHSSEELRTKKVSNNTYEEPVSFEKGELCFIFQCNAIKGLHVKMKAKMPTRQKEV